MNKTYTFKWSKWNIVHIVILCLLEIPWLLFPVYVTYISPSPFFFVMFLPPLLIWGAYIYALLRSHLRHIEIRPGRITVARLVGKPLCWENVQEIRSIDKTWIETYATKRNTNYKDIDTVFSMRNAYYTAPSIGEFERISNNLDELALVTLTNGKKYVINYPQDQITEEAIARVIGKKDVR